MTTAERNAIEKAILAGIETAIEAVVVNPFPPDNLKAALFHCRDRIQNAVSVQLATIRTIS